MQLAGILHLHHTDRVGDGGQLAVCNFLRHRVCISDIQVRVNLAIRILPVDDRKPELKIRTRAILGGFDLALIDHSVIPIRGNRVNSEFRCDLSGIEVEFGHVILLEFSRKLH